MYRVRSVSKVTFEGWPAAITNAARINELAENRGWQASTIWTQTFGPFNELAFERDYPDLATYECETAAFYADKEVMQLVVEGVNNLRGDDPGFLEIWETIETD